MGLNFQHQLLKVIFLATAFMPLAMGLAEQILTQLISINVKQVLMLALTLVRQAQIVVKLLFKLVQAEVKLLVKQVQAQQQVQDMLQSFLLLY